ncbi:DUF2163 domain-containing protein [Aureimonas sp. ME7]|uniref:DUF2163 domain-containing protein n=1 Tax=Aureimonas sp. ME7 TaxID=2744252 RepID=UPI0015F63EFB|nr:DUF2163 domain-containing protein [Aureimonas sp. ME7]
MRAISEAWSERLRRPATTLAHAWRLRRSDGFVLGFTDHDEDLAFAGTVFRAATGWTAGEAEQTLGLAAGSQGIEAALCDEALREEDIAAGLYDAAVVEIFRVDWQAPDDHLLMDVADLGEVTRTRNAFTAELRGIAARLERQTGRFYRRRCDAVFGDRRCGIDPGEWTRQGTLAALLDGAILVEGLGELDAAFGLGRLAVADGSWRAVGSVRPETGRADVVRIELPQPLLPAWDVGDPVRLVIGCDKAFATCRDRFGNGLNFRGFPHMPGTDAALGVAKSGALHDGGPVVP